MRLCHNECRYIGSIVLDDFKLGWSDIDILCLTESDIEPAKADRRITNDY